MCFFFYQIPISFVLIFSFLLENKLMSSLLIKQTCMIVNFNYNAISLPSQEAFLSSEMAYLPIYSMFVFIHISKEDIRLLPLFIFDMMNILTYLDKVHE